MVHAVMAFRRACGRPWLAQDRNACPSSADPPSCASHGALYPASVLAAHPTAAPAHPSPADDPLGRRGGPPPSRRTWTMQPMATSNLAAPPNGSAIRGSCGSSRRARLRCSKRRAPHFRRWLPSCAFCTRTTSSWTAAAGDGARDERGTARGERAVGACSAGPRVPWRRRRTLRDRRGTRPRGLGQRERSARTLV